MSERPTPESDYILGEKADPQDKGLPVVIRRLERQRDAAVEALTSLVSYTEACEGMLNASPAGQVIAARAVLREIGDAK